MSRMASGQPSGSIGERYTCPMSSASAELRHPSPGSAPTHERYGLVTGRDGVSSACPGLRPAVDPIEDRVVPEDAVLGLQDPVVLVGEVQEPRRNPLPL